MAPDTSIRRLAGHEWRAYRRLRLRALRDAPDAFATTLADALAREDAAWARQVSSAAEAPFETALVAESGSRLIGLLWSRIDPSDPDRAQLYQMWVEPEFRRMGTGSKLLDAAIGWAASVKARVVELSVTCGDSAARHLYESAGFEPVGPREPLRPGSDLTVQSMELDLRAG